MTDLYTKAVLTVIALSLSVIAWRGLAPAGASAAQASCGWISAPCYVQGASARGLLVFQND
jgi:hypothetical protein